MAAPVERAIYSMALPRSTPVAPARRMSLPDRRAGAIATTVSLEGPPCRGAEEGPATGRAPVAGPEWWVADAPIDYPTALAAMQDRVGAIRAGQAAEAIWLVEHAPIFTAGTSARDADLFNPMGLPTHRAGRGGQWTYHGPGQRVGYVMLDLKRRGEDVRAFVHGLECWLIAALDRLGVRAETRQGRVGLWVADRRAGTEAKIGAIGVRVTRWVSWHGFSLNVQPNLGHYAGIVPCGIREHGVTSLEALGIVAGMDDVDAALMAAFEAAFPAVEV